MLADRIGLDGDTNRSLTRRMLLLLESVIAGDAVYGRCWELVLDTYLDNSTEDYRPPRFLLNDLVRCWRTICVDFVGKQREHEEKWGLRPRPAGRRRPGGGAAGAAVRDAAGGAHS